MYENTDSQHPSGLHPHYSKTEHILWLLKIYLFAQILKLQGHKNTLSYIKHQYSSNYQQYKLVKLCWLRYLYKQNNTGREQLKQVN